MKNTICNIMNWEPDSISKLCGEGVFNYLKRILFGHTVVVTMADGSTHFLTGIRSVKVSSKLLSGNQTRSIVEFQRLTWNRRDAYWMESVIGWGFLNKENAPFTIHQPHHG